jgi:hypothetical protein
MKKIFLLAALLPLLTTCTKPDPLPPVTEVGAHTFGCYVDGKPFVPSRTRGVINASPSLDFGFMNLRGGRYFNIMASADGGQGFFFFVRGATQVGRYKVDHDALPFTVDAYTPGYIQYFEPGGGYVTTPNHVGWFTLTRCDTVRGIFSGTFEFQAFDPDSKRTVRVTDGRFDLNFLKLKR